MRSRRSRRRIDDLASSVDRLQESVSRQGAQLEALAAMSSRRTDDVYTLFRDVHYTLRTLELQGQIPATSMWLAQADVPETPLVSVITPTRDRQQLLENALASVRAQTYSAYEHIVVDDGSVDGTQQLLEALNDDRVRLVRTNGVGSASARNAGLDHARGDIITYLDDDNRMCPDWLRGVAWAFSGRDDLELLYGARVLDDRRATSSGPSGEMPSFEFFAYERRVLERFNFIDTNVMGHRAGIPDARFATGLDGVEDWDLALRLTERHPPLALPVVACTYTTLSRGRYGHLPETEKHFREIRAGMHTRRPLRVLVVAIGLDPGGVATVSGDVRDLLAAGAAVSCCLVGCDLPDLPTAASRFEDVWAAIVAAQPDVALVAWTAAAPTETIRVAAHCPFVVRILPPPANGVAPPLPGDPSCLAVVADPESGTPSATPGVARPRRPGSGLADDLSAWLAAYRLDEPL